MVASYRFRVSGRVQGVMFRQSTARRARELGIDGWVRNCADGSVEGCAAGSADALEALRRWLHKGPPAARVDAVDWRADAERPEGGFSVRP